MRGADTLVAALKTGGCDTIFALSGNQIMPIFDACLDAGLRLVHTRHEAAAGFMAEGYAQASGRVGVALVTAGGGLANAIAPLMTSKASQTPLVLLSGDSPAGLDGAGAFQEMDQIALTRSLTKLSRRITRPEDLGVATFEAMAIASSGTPGPVHLSLPVDVLEAHCPPPKLPKPAGPEFPDCPAIIAALQRASQPLVILGPALRGASQRLQKTIGCPVLVMESPRGGNDPYLGRIREAWAQADLLVVLGKPVDFSLGYGKPYLFPRARWIAVHDDPEEISRTQRNLGSRLDEMLVCTPRLALEELCSSTDFPDRADWQKSVDALIAARPFLETKKGISSASLCAAVQDLVTPETVLVCDGGEFGQWAQTLRGAGCRIVNGVSGVIGAGICYAIGAKVALPDAQIVAMMGDGTVGFHFSEFETAARENLPFIAVIGNDRRWNAEHLIQMRDYGKERLHGCTLSGARYDQAAEALGAIGYHVTGASQLASTLASAVATQLPVCVNVEIDGLPAPSFQSR